MNINYCWIIPIMVLKYYSWSMVINVSVCVKPRLGERLEPRGPITEFKLKINWR